MNVKRKSARTREQATRKTDMHKVNGSEGDGDGRCRHAQHMVETMGSWTFLYATKLFTFSQHLDPHL